MPRSYYWIFLGILGLSGCGGSSSNTTPGVGNNTIAGPAANVGTVNAGNASNPAAIVNGAFTSVTICMPGSSTCSTIDGMLVDTGSSGIRVLASQLPSGFNLPKQTDSGGNPIGECNQFADGVTWGPVEMADIKISSEVASSIPIQVIADPAFAAIPSGCNSGPDENTVSTLGANGILGVGNFLQDCGPACTSLGGNPGFYYSCPNTGCVVVAQALNAQLQHPVAHFATDNNGVILELPTVGSSGAVSITGALVFGIGTQSNNSLGSATVLTLDSSGSFATSFQGQSFTGSFIDSGSNGIFFLDSTTTRLPMCTVNTDFYCPASTQNFTATNTGMNNHSTGINFSIGNADTLLSNQTLFLFNNIGAPSPGNFDWGLPFFFGRNIFVAIEAQNTPGGTGPYVAY